MIPRLDHREAVSDTAQMYVQALHTLGFEGDIHCDDATRAVLATDNSIYQIYPQVVVFPKNHNDLIRIARASHDHDVLYGISACRPHRLGRRERQRRPGRQQTISVFYGRASFSARV